MEIMNAAEGEGHAWDCNAFAGNGVRHDYPGRWSRSDMSAQVALLGGEIAADSWKGAAEGKQTSVAL